ncbi:MAG: HAMP domain-containing histidine kinase [Lachnospiraceae bacterium]|nr:HAMP domain-containing histidine kinase [Lachnospiraceae bacterium]
MRGICTTYGEGDIELSELRNIFASKLTWYLVGCVVIAGAISFASVYILAALGETFVENRYDKEAFNIPFQKKYMKNLREYVVENEITLRNISDIKNWTDAHYYVYLAVYQNEKQIFNSDYADTGTVQSDEETASVDMDSLYRMELSDGTVVSVEIFCYDYWKYYYYIWFACILFGITLFIVIFTNMLQTKLRYISQIERELRILEGGNLEYPITIRGTDEIGNLARGIEQMRLSIIENMKKERLLLQSNKDLVTALSHDLRTPLTTLTGYLEILNMSNGKEEQEKQRYLELSLAKTREIRELSDELFEYFLIYGEERKKLTLEEVPAYMLAVDLIENQFLSLEEAGYQLQSANYLEETAGNCRINAKYMQRVLNNILSNLEKYADRDRPVEVAVMKEQSFLVIRVRNGIRKNLEAHESTKIGLITCEQIMKLHHGEFRKYEVEDEFTVKLILPMIPEERKE